MRPRNVDAAAALQLKAWAATQRRRAQGVQVMNSGGCETRRLRLPSQLRYSALEKAWHEIMLCVQRRWPA